MGTACMHFDFCPNYTHSHLHVSILIPTTLFGQNEPQLGQDLMDFRECSEWIGKAIATLLFGTVAMMIWARRRGNIQDKASKIVIYTGSDQTTMESIVLAQRGLRNVYDLIQSMNILLLKIWSILVSKAPKVHSILPPKLCRSGCFTSF